MSEEVNKDEQNYPPPTSDFWYGDADLFDARRTEKATPRSAQKIATSYACVDAIAKTCAILPPSVYRSKSNGAKDLQVEHALYKVLRRPNPIHDRFQFWQLKERTQLLYGNFFAQIVRNGFGDIIALYPIHPDFVSVKQIDGEYDFEYQIQTRKGTEFVHRHNMFHTREPGEDGIIGRSRIQIAAEIFQLSLGYLHHNNALIQNDSRPLGLIIPKAPIKTKEAKDNLIEGWESAHKGPRRAGRVAVVPFEVEYKALSMTARDAQLLELMEFSSIDQINTLWDVPPYRTQDYRRATFNNVEQADINWGKNSISPRVVATEEAIMAQLLDIDADPEIFVKFNLNAMFRADIKTRNEAHAISVQNGWMNRQEVRLLEDMDPVEGQGLEEFLVPSNLMASRGIPIDIEAKEKAAKEPKEEPADPAPVPDKDPESAADESEELSRKLRPEILRLVNKEVRALAKILKKGTAWIDESQRFYEKHRAHMSESLSDFIDSPAAVQRGLKAFGDARADFAQKKLSEGGPNSLISAVLEWKSAGQIDSLIEIFVSEALKGEQ